MMILGREAGVNVLIDYRCCCLWRRWVAVVISTYDADGTCKEFRCFTKMGASRLGRRVLRRAGRAFAALKS